MANVIEFVYCIKPSNSGGKVWGIPRGNLMVRHSFNGTLNRFRNGSVTINYTKEKDGNLTLSNKQRDGYSIEGYVWIDVDTGEVFQQNPNVNTQSGGLAQQANQSINAPEIKIKGGGLFSF